MAKKIGKRSLAMLLSFIMIFSMVNLSVLAADAEPQLVTNYEDTYYKQDGSAGTAKDWEIHLSKQATATQTPNVYDITLTVETKDTSVELAGATHGAVVLVLDVSNSMDESPDGCVICGESEDHADHKGTSNLCPDGSGNSYEKPRMGGKNCENCGEKKKRHVQGQPVCDYVEQEVHLERLKEAVTSFLNSYVEDVAEGDKRLVSVAVFGTDAVTIQNWVDVTDADALSDVKALVNALSTGNGAYLDGEYLTNGGTNIEAGLVLGRNLLNDSEALAGIPVDNQSLILFSDGAPTARVDDVDDDSVTEVAHGGNDTGTRTDDADFDDIADILDGVSAAAIAVQYNYEDENNALAAFDRVIASTADSLSVDLTGEAGNIITTVTVPTIITDPMGDGVSMVNGDENYEDGAWNLGGFTPFVSGGVTSYTITYQVEIDPTAVAADPVYEGYTILTPANGTTTLDYTVGDSETTVQAEFNVPDIRGILPRFDLTVNYVDEQGVAIAEQIVEAGILYGKAYATEQKTIAGYTFEYMTDGSDAAEGTMNANKVVTYVYSANPIPVYPVSYEYTGNIPANAPALPETVEYEAGAAVAVAAAPELEGYTFSGWSKTDFTMPAEAVVIQGSWTKIVPPAPVKYPVSYEYTGNIPANAPALPAAVKYEAGAAVAVAAAPELEGYAFSGWSKTDFTMPAEAVVIQGSWTKIVPPAPVKYPVSYEYTGNIPANAPALPETVEYEAGAAVTVAAAPELAGYTFSGWSKNDFTMPAEAVAIQGSWTKIVPPAPVKYPVSYEYTGNIPANAPALPETVEYEAGAAVTVAAAPELAGYTFSGWSKNDFTMPAEAVVIQGSWTKIVPPAPVKYPVSYEYTGEVPVNAPTLPETVEYEAGAAVTVVAAPELAGYIFSGWNKVDFIMPGEAVVIQGSWTKIVPPAPVKYPVSYEYTGEVPVNAPALPETVEYEDGAAVTVAAAPELEGYTFSGWSKADFTMPAEAVVIQGSWTKIVPPAPPEPPAPPVKETGALTISKTVIGKAEVPADLGFRVTGPDGYSVFVLYADFVNGSYTLNELDPGKYTVSEENAEVSQYTLKTEGEGDVEVVADQTARISIINTYAEEIIPYVPPIEPYIPPMDPVDPEPPVEPPVDPEPPVEPPVDPEPPVEPPVEPELPVEPPVDPNPVEIPDEDVPLSDEPIDLPDDDVPLADVPKTDDKMALYQVLVLLSGMGLAWLTLSEKKRRSC